MSIEIEIPGLERFILAAQRLPDLFKQEFGSASEASLYGVVGILKRYPSEPSGSTYRRTKLLGRTWTTATPTFEAVSGGFEGRLGNNTPYAPFVQGPRQAMGHRGRWTTADQALEQQRPTIEQHFVAAGHRLMAVLAGDQ